MAWRVQSVSAPVQSELARYLRQQAEECLRLSSSVRDQHAAAASELIVMAASLHERALKLERKAPPPKTADETV
jgi:cytochrome P450